jgi:hypothetical protein
MAYGVILKHLEVDKITLVIFFLFKKKEEGAPLKRGADSLFSRKEVQVTLFLTGVENTGCPTLCWLLERIGGKKEPKECQVQYFLPECHELID